MSAVAEVISIVAPRPPWKFVGGKRQLLPELHEHVPEKFSHYFEPFFGGGALYWSLRPKKAVVGDANREIVVALQVIKSDVGALITELRRAAAAHLQGRKKFFLKLRASEPSSPLKTAARFMVLNRLGFNGVYRVNGSGKFNVPYGKWKSIPKICDEENLRACAEALKSCVIVCGDFEKVVQGATRGDFVYFDPPYAPASATADFTSYTRDGFTLDDQERLRDLALKLKARGVHVLLSNADVPAVRKLYRIGFLLRKVSARRSVNSNTSKRGKVGELLIW